jgi:predicted nucleotidyltransferase component of viral defense system
MHGMHIIYPIKKGGECMDKRRIIRLERFPEDLHYRLKVFAVVNNTTMKDVIIQAVTEYLHKHEKKKKRR